MRRGPGDPGPADPADAPGDDDGDGHDPTGPDAARHRQSAELVERPGRRGAIDVARSLALLVVVVGHLSLAVVDRAAGDVRGANLLALRPQWAWVAALAPMPVFFAAAGWANATATLSSGAHRLRTLVGVGVVVVTVWSAGVVIAELVAGEPGIVADGARVATQPLWFLAAYVPFAAAGRRLARLAATHVVLAIVLSLGTLALLDVARFGAGAPHWIGWPGFFVAWGVPWLIGGWWRDRWEGGRIDERRTGLALAVGATAGGALLVAVAGYAAPLIDAVPDLRSNTTPPTLYTAVAGLGQAGALIAAAGVLDRAGRRWRRVWDRAGQLAVGVYVWHLTGLTLCVGAIALGFPVPTRLTTTWWLTRPLWWLAVLAVTALLVVATATARARVRARPQDVARRVHTADGRLVAGVVLGAAAAAAVGLEGPRTVPLAIACTGLFVAAWRLLRQPEARVAP